MSAQDDGAFSLVLYFMIDNWTWSLGQSKLTAKTLWLRRVPQEAVGMPEEYNRNEDWSASMAMSMYIHDHGCGLRILYNWSGCTCSTTTARDNKTSSVTNMDGAHSASKSASISITSTMSASATLRRNASAPTLKGNQHDLHNKNIDLLVDGLQQWCDQHCRNWKHC